MTVCGSIAAWRTLAGGWGDITSIANLSWAFVILPFLTALGVLSSFSCPGWQGLKTLFSLSGDSVASFLLLENLEAGPILDYADHHQYSAISFFSI
jgi:hypothetical protein